MKIKIFQGWEELYHGAAETFVNSAKEAVQHNGKFSVAFCGGKTPLKFYELLAAAPYRDQVPWKDVHVFWTDEQWVFHNDLRNNAKIAFDLLLDHVPVPPQQICRISGELGPLDSAMQYECILQEFFGNEPPKLDLVYLNLGEDGSTAALLPGSAVLAENNDWVKAIYQSENKLYRITLTAQFINNARRIVFLIVGSEKSTVFGKIVAGRDSPKIPAQLIAPTEGELIFLVEKEAASKIF